MAGLTERRGQFADWSMIGLFFLAAFAVMRSMSELLAPMIAAVIFGALLSRMVDRLARAGLPPVVSAVGLLAVTGLLIVTFVDSLLEPLAGFIAHAPDMLKSLVEALTPLAQPFLSPQQALSSSVGGQSGSSILLDKGFSGLTAFFGGVTPAIAEFGIFFVTMAFFVAGRVSLRRWMIMSWENREQRFPPCASSTQLKIPWRCISPPPRQSMPASVS
jgi:predicted PurR-regulated permease PerM